MTDLQARPVTVRRMEKVTLTRRLRGRMTVVSPGVVDVDLAARGTRVAARRVFDDETRFNESGSVDLGHGDELRFRSLEPGTLARVGDGGARHGTSVLAVVGGSGRFTRAIGRITSNFVVSPDGAITEEQVAVVFIDRKEQ